MASTAIAQGKSGAIEQVALGRIPLAALVASVAAIIANVALLLIGRATGAITDDVALPNGATMGPGPVISITVFATVMAAIVYAILGAIGRIRRPITIFRLLALVLLLGSFVTPFGIVGAGVGYIALLLLMHVATAAAVVWALTTLARR